MTAIWELVRNAETRALGLPEIQRKYRWDAAKARKLADSLYRGWPIGGLTMWKPPAAVQVVSRMAGDTGLQPAEWVIDGASRVTTLCTLFGTRPYWTAGGDPVTYKVQFNPRTEEFRTIVPTRRAVSADPEGRRSRGRPPVWVDVHEVLGGTEQTVQALVSNLKLEAGEQITVMSRLLKLHGIRKRVLPVDHCELELEEIAEVFARLNAQGAKVTPSEIALAMAAARNPGLVAGHVQPFLDEMAGRSFQLDPTLLLRSLVAIWRGKIAFRDIKAEEWGDPYTVNEDLMAGWRKATGAWQAVASYLAARGLHRLEDLTSRIPLLPVVVARAFWPELLDGDRAMGWVLRAIRCGHYAASTDKVATDDVAALLRVRDAGGTAADALAALEGRLSFGDADLFRGEELLRDAAAENGRDMKMFLYLLFFARGARDWVSREPLVFAAGGTSPQWHHLFPREHLSQHGVDSAERNLLANYALLTSKTNRAFSCDAPGTYLHKAGLTDLDAAGLPTQLVPTDPRLLTTSAYKEFLSLRSSQLAAALNVYLTGMSA